MKWQAEAERRLSFLGRPVLFGLSDRPAPVVPWEGRVVRLSREMRLEGATVWYEVLGKKELVLYAVEPRS